MRPARVPRALRPLRPLRKSSPRVPGVLPTIVRVEEYWFGVLNLLLLGRRLVVLEKLPRAPGLVGEDRELHKFVPATLRVHSDRTQIHLGDVALRDNTLVGPLGRHGLHFNDMLVARIAVVGGSLSRKSVSGRARHSLRDVLLRINTLRLGRLDESLSKVGNERHDEGV